MADDIKYYDDIAKSVLHQPFMAQQKWTELSRLLQLLDKERPINILELGVFKGGTIMAWTHVADKSAQIIGVDLPNGRYGGGFTSEEAERIKRLALYNQNIELLALDSHKESTINRVKKYGLFDFIFIDADHTYEGVKQDFEGYFPLLRKGGIIALHDIVEHTNYHDVKVHVFWNELKQRFINYEEFIDLSYPTDHGYWGGIGVIKL